MHAVLQYIRIINWSVVMQNDQLTIIHDLFCGLPEVVMQLISNFHLADKLILKMLYLNAGFIICFLQCDLFKLTAHGPDGISDRVYATFPVVDLFKV